jgi:hypothetical protein
MMTKKAATKQPNPIKGTTPWPKGQSGNPKGRPPKLPGLDLLLASVMGEEENGVSAAQTLDVTSAGQAITPPIIWSDGK